MNNTKNNDEQTSKSTPVSTGDTQQTTVFIDDESMISKRFDKGSQAGLLCSVQPMADLASFFKRPIEVANFEWTGADSVLSTLGSFEPWKVWMLDETIQNKLQTYRNFRGNMHLRFIINSNKFLYGTIAVFYEPMKDLSTYQVRSAYTSASQLPGVRMGSAHNFSQEMELPFVWPTDWFDLTTTDSEFRTLGAVTLQVINNLKNVSAVTDSNDKVEVTVYGWMEDVQLSGLTVRNTFASSGEYEDADGIISGPASAVAGVAHAVADMMSGTLIGRLAKSTEIGSSGIARIAALWGFSRPANIKGLAKMKNIPFANTATCIGGEPVAKLTVDPKQELTVDGTYCGLNNTDDMSISTICCTESFVGTFPFSTVNTTGQEILTFPVRPFFPTYTASANSDSPVELPAISFASMPFEYWRGSIIYRFEIICTQFHKGRIRIIYEPSSIPGTFVQNRNFIHILDISEVEDTSIIVDWAQPEHWKPVDAELNITTSRKNSLNYPINGELTHLESDNGRIFIEVVNELSVPDRTLNFSINPVEINVYMKAGPDFEVAVPTTLAMDNFKAYPGAAAQGFTAKTLEESETPEKQVKDDPDETCCANLAEGPKPAANLIYMGESIHSFRTLCKRYCFHFGARYDNTVAQSATAIYDISMRRFPLLPGIVANGCYDELGTAVNEVGWTYPAWCSLGYAVERGATRWKMVTSRPNQNGLTGSVTRKTTINDVTDFSDYYSAKLNQTLLVGNVNFELNKKLVRANDASGNGTFLFDMDAQPGVEFEIPYQCSARFRPAVSRDQISLNNVEGTADFDMSATVQIESFSGAAGLNDVKRNVHKFYNAAGEDFSLHWFLGTATLYIYDT